MRRQLFMIYQKKKGLRCANKEGWISAQWLGLMFYLSKIEGNHKQLKENNFYLCTKPSGKKKLNRGRERGSVYPKVCHLCAAL